MPRPDPETELRRLLRVPEDGTYNLADYIAAHGAALGVQLPYVSGPDEVVVPCVRELLDARRSERRATRRGVVEEALGQIQREAYWRGDHVVLAPMRILQIAATAGGKKYLRFIGDGLDVSVATSVLRRTRAALRRFRSVSMSVDADGLQVRWLQGRGGLNFYGQRLKQPADAIVVTLPCRTATRKMPVLLAEVLGEMGYGI